MPNRDNNIAIRNIVKDSIAPVCNGLPKVPADASHRKKPPPGGGLHGEAGKRLEFIYCTINVT